MSAISKEIENIKDKFPNASADNIKAMEPLIEQAAYETLYLKTLNEQALKSGLIEFHPENAKMQRTLPISNEIAKHSAALTNITDKLMKWLSVEVEDEDDDLSEYE